jgi:hypothetical protein
VNNSNARIDLTRRACLTLGAVAAGTLMLSGSARSAEPSSSGLTQKTFSTPRNRRRPRRLVLRRGLDANITSREASLSPVAVVCGPTMKLSDFLLTHGDEIAQEWEAFARTCTPAAATMNVARLRNHGCAIRRGGDQDTVCGGTGVAAARRGLADLTERPARSALQK